MPHEVVERHPVGGNATGNVSSGGTGFPYHHLVHPPSLTPGFSTGIWGGFAHSSWRAKWERSLCKKKAEQVTFPSAGMGTQ